MYLQGSVDWLDRDRLSASVLNQEMRAGHHALRATEALRRRRHLPSFAPKTLARKVLPPRYLRLSWAEDARPEP
jgi:hypothetical protein